MSLHRDRGVLFGRLADHRTIATAVALTAALLTAPAFSGSDETDRVPAWTRTAGGAAGIWRLSFSAIYATATFDDGTGEKLYVGGDFFVAGGVRAHAIACFDGETWSTLGAGLPSAAIVWDMTVFDDGRGPALFVAGIFSSAGGRPARGLARWDGATWSDVGGSLNGSAFGLLVDREGDCAVLRVAGNFTEAGGIPAHRIASWNGTTWSPLGSGFDDGFAMALTRHDDGSGRGLQLVAGGSFTSSGGTPAWRVARWDGAEWSQIGEGVLPFGPSPNVFRFLSVADAFGTGSRIYACGGIASHGGEMPSTGILEWDGRQWTGVGGGLNGAPVFTVTRFDDPVTGAQRIVAGGPGSFPDADGAPIDYLAQWDGRHWSAIGAAPLQGVQSTASPMVTDLFERSVPGGRELVVGGFFHYIGALGVQGMAQWDGRAWHLPGSGATGLSPAVRSSTMFDDGLGAGPQLVIGGEFASIGGKKAYGVARWDGAEWQPIGSGLGGVSPNPLQMPFVPQVHALAAFDDGSGPALYAGGDQLAFFNPSVQFTRLARWNGVQWQPVVQAPLGRVRALVVFDDGSGAGPALYVGGEFASISGVPSTQGVARWDGAHWTAVGTGVNGNVSALTIFDDGSGPALVAGGSFTMAGGVPARRVAKWDGRAWSPLGDGLDNGAVVSLCADPGHLHARPSLFVGGSFASAGGEPAARIARWDGSAWSACGTGASTTVTALELFDPGDGAGTRLYVAGGTVESPRLAAWDGAVWSFCDVAIPTDLLGGGVISMLQRMPTQAPFGPSLLVGGAFRVSAAGDSGLTRLVPGGHSCRADLARDGTVDGADLTVVLGAWGAKGPSASVADLNDDGIVDGNDLAIVLGTWGACQ